ncbi:MAG: PmoA family protein [Verrucomicrobia bacterium]|nr:PmoA family protein [Verrucomicrobiota bacterium]
MARAYADYAASEPGRWFEDHKTSGLTAAATPAGQRVTAEARADRVVIRVNDAPFTEYLFGPDSKYPYFYPRARAAFRSYGHRAPDRTLPASQLDLLWLRPGQRGQLLAGGPRARAHRVPRRAVGAVRGEHIEFEQTCRWERPGAEAPFDDVRRITVSAPDPDVRFLDFDITLTARTAVRIEQNNHSLFAARMAPDLAVTGGGTLMNAHGETGEKATFGHPAPWADYRGNRAGVTEGVTILSHPTNRWFPEPWFTRDYGFFSPTPLNWLDGGAVVFAPGEVLRLRYRVVVHANAPPARRSTAGSRPGAADPPEEPECRRQNGDCREGPLQFGSWSLSRSRGTPSTLPSPMSGIVGASRHSGFPADCEHRGWG